MPQKRTPAEIGKRYGMLTIKKELPDRPLNHGKNVSVRMVLAECDCGSLVPLLYSNVTSMNTRSCGCSTQELRKIGSTGVIKTPEKFVSRVSYLPQRYSEPCIPESEMKEPNIKRNKKLIRPNIWLMEYGLINNTLGMSWCSLMHERTREFLDLTK